MATIRFTEADRDERGFVTVPSPEPRSLADLLPTADSIQQDARRAAPRPMSLIEVIGLGLVAIVAAVVVVYGWRGSGAARPAAPPSIPAATPSSGDRTPMSSPLPATPPAVAGRLLVAFASPDGAVLGPIESTRLITPTAHYGNSWIQADVAGSGLIWLRAADVPQLAITGPDLAPQPTAPLPAPAPQRPAAAIEPSPTPAPQCAEVGVPGKMVSACGYDDLSALQEQAKQQWLATYGGTIATVAVPTPQRGNEITYEATQRALLFDAQTAYARSIGDAP